METKSHEPLVIDTLSYFGAGEWEDADKPSAIATPSTGTDHIDLEFFRFQDVPVYSLLDDREALSEIHASSEFTFMAILMGLRRIDRLIGSLDRRDAGHELYGKWVGIVGMGRNGQNVAKWCLAFGAHVTYYDPYNDKEEELPPRRKSLSMVFERSDIVVLTCTYNSETYHMIDKPLMASMVENAVLVNTSRGAVINEKDLIDVLRLRPDLTAVLDVMEGEIDGTAKDSALWYMKNAIITPHIAGYTHESLAKANAIAERLLYNGKDGEEARKS